MFKNAKAFILGFLSCTLIFILALTVFAAPVEKTVTAIYNGIKIKINGEEFIPKDADGKIVEPFQVDGTTYLPVRAVSEALGIDVEWEQETKTVLLSGTPELIEAKDDSQSSSKVFHINEPDDSTYAPYSDIDHGIGATVSDVVSDIELTVNFKPVDPEVRALALKFDWNNNSPVYFKTTEEAGKALPFAPKGLSYIPEGYSFHDVRSRKDENGNYDTICWQRYISDKVLKVDKTTPADIYLTANYLGENATIHVHTNKYVEQITLNGSIEAVFISYERVTDKQKVDTYDLIWIKDGIAYSLSSSRFNKAEMIKMAESVK